MIECANLHSRAQTLPSTSFRFGSLCRFGAELGGSLASRQRHLHNCGRISAYATKLSSSLKRGATAFNRNWCNPLCVLPINSAS